MSDPVPDPGREARRSVTDFPDGPPADPAALTEALGRCLPSWGWLAALGRRAGELERLLTGEADVPPGTGPGEPPRRQDARPKVTRRPATTRGRRA